MPCARWRLKRWLPGRSPKPTRASELESWLGNVRARMCMCICVCIVCPGLSERMEGKYWKLNGVRELEATSSFRMAVSCSDHTMVFDKTESSINLNRTQIIRCAYAQNIRKFATLFAFVCLYVFRRNSSDGNLFHVLETNFRSVFILTVFAIFINRCRDLDPKNSALRIYYFIRTLKYFIFFYIYILFNLILK